MAKKAQIKFERLTNGGHQWRTIIVSRVDPQFELRAICDTLDEIRKVGTSHKGKTDRELVSLLLDDQLLMRGLARQAHQLLVELRKDAGL